MSFEPSGASAAPNDLSVDTGLLAWPYNPAVATTATAPASGSVFGSLVHLPAGTTVTGVKTRLQVAAAGTLPTTARAGIADLTGKILALSANINALASWAQGVDAWPCFVAGTQQLVTSYTGGYFACVVVNGTWGTTQPTITNCNTGSSASTQADGTFPPVCFVWAGQTDLPAVGASMTITVTDQRERWLAVY